jgi:N-acetylglucosaminyldiphosphoundecaprenol N-acetyl-beta-D-mannosaminyltransferase
MKIHVLPYARVDVFGTPITVISFQEVMDVVLGWKDCGDRKPLCVSFPGLNPIFATVLEKKYANLYHGMDLVLPDGRNIARVARLLGSVLPEKRIAGMDFLPEVCSRLKVQDHSVGIVGASAEAVDAFSRCLQDKYGVSAGRITSRWVAPFAEVFTMVELRDHVDQLNRLKPDIIVVGIASPKQEGIGMILRDNLQYAAVILCIGGAMQTTAGIIPMAPQWVRNLGLESFYRFSREPRRLFKRYLVYNTVFPLFLVVALFKRYVLGRKFLE